MKLYLLIETLLKNNNFIKEKGGKNGTPRDYKRKRLLIHG